jgi:hypothetical protein
MNLLDCLREGSLPTGSGPTYAELEAENRRALEEAQKLSSRRWKECWVRHPEEAKSIFADVKPDPETVDFNRELLVARARHNELWRMHLRLSICYTDWPPDYMVQRERVNQSSATAARRRAGGKLRAVWQASHSRWA